MASAGDHYWLAALRRWATPAEVMNLFAVPTDAPVRSLLLPQSPLSAVQVVAAMGQAVYPPCCEMALRAAMQAVSLPQPARYASICSGIDLFTVALDHVLGPGGWVYVHAAECQPGVAAALATAYAPRGLTLEAVSREARCTSDAHFAAASDILMVSSPCQAFSRRNHGRAEAGFIREEESLGAMLHYARRHRPLIVIVENVEEAEAKSAISAALRFLPGYALQVVPMSALSHGIMARGRFYWVMTRAA